MWFRPLCALILLGSVAFGQDPPGPGEPASEYTDGAFTEPRGEQSTYRMGATMNISWHTTYETSNLWLIVGWSFNTPIQLAANTGQTWYQWEVTTDSKNSSEIYAFRIVNAFGTPEDQQSGGFLSAAFWIGGLETTSQSSSSTASHISTSASAPATTSTTTSSTISSSSTASAQAAESTIESQPSGLTDSAKIGVGVGVGVGGLGVIALIIGILLYRRSRSGKTQAAGNMEPYLQTKPPQSYYGAPGAQSYNEYYKPPDPAAMGRGAELDAGQGYRFTPEAYSDNTSRRDPMELQG
ncbi:hypothetical protein F5Y13DRAFT_166149 [Hypoxylon sp. FL1857]|nr:hypothetical protein F5Y13DRAFT_166149 [Hypoxylon sp. FL1857]